jgi:hypothetical protein
LEHLCAELLPGAINTDTMLLAMRAGSMLLCLMILIHMVRIFGEENIFAKLGFFSEYELNQASYYLDSVAPNYTHFNAGIYNAHLRECAEHHSKTSEHMALLNCYDGTTHTFRKSSELWTPRKQANARSLPDCKYDIEFEGVWPSQEAAGQELNGLLKFVYFRFRIEEHGCTSQVVNVRGGSTFNAFAYTSQGLASCTVQDHVNSSYSLQCTSFSLQFPFSMGSSNTSNSTENLYCLSLTLILEHEHFDAYSVIQDVWSAAYTGPRQMLVDDKMYCQENTHELFPRREQAVVSSKTEDIINVYMVGPDRQYVESRTAQQSVWDLSIFPAAHYRMSSSALAIYSGLWTSQGNGSELRLYASCAPFQTHGLGSDLGLINIKCPHKLSQPPGTFYSLVSCYKHDFGSEDLLSLWSSHQQCYFQGVTYRGNMGAQLFPANLGIMLPRVSISTELPNQFAFKATKRSVATNPHQINTRYTLPRIHRLDRLINPLSIKFYFIGASHLRWLVLTLLSDLFGEDTIARISRKSDNIEYTGQQAKHNTFTYQFSAYVHEQISAIKRICAVPSSQVIDGGGENNVLIVQAGDWELTVGTFIIDRFIYYTFICIRFSFCQV